MLGNVQQTQQIIGTTVPVAGSIAAPLVGGSVAATLGISTAIAVPLIGAAVAGLTFAIMQFTQGCQSCIVTSNQANKIEQLMQQNLAAWNSSNKTCAEKVQCVANFDALWGALVQFCSNPQFGGAGKNCIGDRQQGACHYGTAPNCWNWFVGYRDPIANTACTDVTAVNNIASPIVEDLSQIVSSLPGGLDWTTILALGLFVVGITKIV